jgi:hypothetical protein
MESDHVLDIDAMTANAAKLSYAFSMTTGDLSLASSRIALLDIVRGRYPSVFNQLLEIDHA